MGSRPNHLRCRTRQAHPGGGRSSACLPRHSTALLCWWHRLHASTTSPRGGIATSRMLYGFMQDLNNRQKCIYLIHTCLQVPQHIGRNESLCIRWTLITGRVAHSATTSVKQPCRASRKCIFRDTNVLQNLEYSERKLHLKCTNSLFCPTKICTNWSPGVEDPYFFQKTLA